MKRSQLSPFQIRLQIILALLLFATFPGYVNADQAKLNNTNISSLLSQEQQFLPVDQAFQLSATQLQNGDVEINWDIAKDYYLYRHRFKFAPQNTSAQDLKPRIPAGIAKHDEYFGDVEVYYNRVSVVLPTLGGVNDDEGLNIRVSYQGCAEAGLCYPPQDRYIRIQADQIDIAKETTANDSTPNATPNSTKANSTPATVTEEQRYTNLLTNASLASILGLFFLAGLALTFTPCVLPMVPIISSVVMGQGQYPGRRRAFALSLTYVLAMALTYAAAGTITGYFGAELNLQMKLQSPWVLSTVALLFVLFALAMFGLYELRLPNAIESRIHDLSQKQRGGTYIGVALIGMLSSLVVSPCVTAPLAGALVYISSTGDPFLGGTALMSLGLGMGVPLLLIGTFGAQILPKTGQWMNQVKVFFGVLLLAIAIWMVERILPAPATLALTALLAIGYAIYLGAPQAIRKVRLQNPAQLLGLALFGYSALLIAGAINGGFNPLAPIDNLSTNKQQANHAIMQRFNTVTDLAAFDREISLANNQGKPVMLDIYADWCVSCKILEHEVFPAPSVSKALEPFVLLRADVTRNSSINQAFLDRFGLFGPPGLLFFHPDASELRAYRIQGEITVSELTEHLTAIIENLQPAVTLATNKL